MDDSPLPSELALLEAETQRLLAVFAPLAPRVVSERVAAVLREVGDRLRDNYPFHHPLYAGQMLKPPHPIARLSYALAQTLNPNNHALDGGRASSMMEKEAVAALAAMIGWEQHLGHLCSGGTVANLEALWIAGRLKPGQRIVASQQAHYTHARLSEVLGLAFTVIPVDARGRLDPAALEAELRKGDVGTVVATLGATALGAVDPLPDILRLRGRFDFRVHVDAAYGGYFGLIDNLEPDVIAAYAALREADSCVIDPHKHGLQPYGCGCVVFRDPSVARFYQHDSPATYFSSDELHLGEISLECSRPGAAAVALWATQRLLPLERGGEFAQGLADGREAALELHRRLCQAPAFMTAMPPQLDIVIWAPAAKLASDVARRSRRIFERAARLGLHLSVAEIPADILQAWWPGVRFDQARVACLRSCLMKPEHRPWLDEIWQRLLTSVDEEEKLGWK